MTPRPQKLRLLAALLLTALLALAAPEPRDLAGEVSQANYSHYMNNLLYTHLGDNRGPYGPEHDLARANIQRVFESFGLVTTLHAFQWRGATFYNVVGLLPGRVRPNEYHVVGAHYDSVDNPGANDDADGVSAVLEAARVLSTYDLESSIYFLAYDLEERGLVGSRAWVADHRSERVLSALNLDGIAFNGENEGHDGMGLSTADNASNPTLTAITNALALYSGGIHPVYWGVSRDSDHYSFAGFAPAVSMTEASWDLYASARYHRPNDSIDTPGAIDLGFGTAITRTVVGYLATQAGLMPESEDRLRFGAAGVYNAASFVVETIAPAQFISLFGSGFGSSGTTVTIRDAAGLESAIAPIYASPRQINLLTPETLASGPSTITITRTDGVSASAVVPVAATAPGVFTATQRGDGPPAAQAVRVTPEGALFYQDLFVCNSGGCAESPIGFGFENDRVFLVLYGTGIRGRNSLAAVSLDIQGQRLPAQYAGPHATIAGLDQVNIELPRSIQGRNYIDATLWVDGRAANPVRLDLGGLP